MDDILDTNPFTSIDSINSRPTNTYGVQHELKRHALNEHVNQKAQVLEGLRKEDLVDNKNILDDDLLNTNPNMLEEIGEVIDKSRFIKEIRTCYNIDSRNRKLYKEELVPRDPNTKQYTREALHPETGDFIVERYTADDLNLEYQQEYSDNPVIDPFIEKNGDIYYRSAQDYNPNCYQIELPKMLHNVKSIRLVSSEIPNPNQTVNSLNNLILVDVHDEDLELSKEAKSLGVTKSIIQHCNRGEGDGDSLGMPFFLVKIPVGNYTLDRLIEAMEEQVNKEIEDRTWGEYRNLFRITGDNESNKVEIELISPEGKNLSFHWRFWFAPGIPEKNLLYHMLGFSRPYERNLDGTSKYLTVWNNLVNVAPNQSKLVNINVNRQAQNRDPGLSLVHYGLRQVRPSRSINLCPQSYIYLVIEQAKTMVDLDHPSSNTFAKIQLPVAPGEIAYNTFVGCPKFYTEAIRKLDKLDIKWIDGAGNLVDFHGQEHSFTLEITQYLDQLSVNNYSSQRGVTDSTSFTSKERVFSYH